MPTLHFESFYRIIKEYEKITGLPSIINTSFDMHEEPIVCTLHDAVRAFLKGKLDHLAMGNFLVLAPQKGAEDPHKRVTAEERG